jgi:hypothetical protein
MIRAAVRFLRRTSGGGIDRPAQKTGGIMATGPRTGGAPRWVRPFVICCAATLLIALTVLYLTTVQVRTAVARLERDGARARAVRGIPYADLINRVSTAHRLNPALVAAVVSVESNFNARARSHRGAYGLMQVMPQTWRAFGSPRCPPLTARLTIPPCMDDPAANLDVGAAYLRALLDRFGGDPLLALAAYNAGTGAVTHHAGVPPFPETTRYLRLVALAWMHLQDDGTLTPFWLGVIRSLHVWEHARVAVLVSTEALDVPRHAWGPRLPVVREGSR